MFPADLHGRRGHSAALGSDGHTIYYFGGLKGTSERRPLDNSYFGFNDISMNEILVFDTYQLTWMKRTSNNSVIPSARYLHTTTSSTSDTDVAIKNANNSSLIVPGTDDILLYGGRHFGTKKPVDDYCYIYNTVNNEWTRIHLPASTGAGPRFGHSGTTREYSSCLGSNS